MVHKYDTERAVGLLRQYQASLTSPEEQALKTSVGKVSAIFGSQLFKALLDIQECYEVTLQLNATENAAKENGSKEMLEFHILLFSKASAPCDKGLPSVKILQGSLTHCVICGEECSRRSIAPYDFVEMQSRAVESCWLLSEKQQAGREG
ncbi:hypothetical protein PDJAM_G00230870 [Pangasius djambal]|uniref:Uncharacterized protein n=1 Tax=Pangasius djambal TaxID=1691987 RepID=A0ACC5YF05_9TELE|nr:hypothetical protein [Pangasius djambal]